jgi:hypothetical protein
LLVVVRTIVASRSGVGHSSEWLGLLAILTKEKAHRERIPMGFSINNHLRSGA